MTLIPPRYPTKFKETEEIIFDQGALPDGENLSKFIAGRQSIVPCYCIYNATLPGHRYYCNIYCASFLLIKIKDVSALNNFFTRQISNVETLNEIKELYAVQLLCLPHNFFYILNDKRKEVAFTQD